MPWLRSHLRRLGLAVAVSLGVTALTQLVLALLVSLAGWPPAVANVAAVAVGTGASFSASRRVVWAGRTGRSFWIQVIPFWVQSFSGLVLSTLAVAAAAARWGTGWPVTAASVTAWLVIWPAGYLLNDLFVFAAGPADASVARSPATRTTTVPTGGPATLAEALGGPTPADTAELGTFTPAVR